MLTVFYCVVYQHDLRLVVLAGLICALASFTAFTLLHHVRKSSGQMRDIWLGVAAVTTGFGIWATHFIAMLAFTPGIPSAYNITLTFLSLVAAVVLTGIGFLVALSKRESQARAAIGGLIVGGGIAALHYTGMAAFEIAGRIMWDPVLVAASIVLGGLIGAIALAVGLNRSTMPQRIYGGLLLTVAICSHHFTAMGAAAIVPDPTVVVSPWAIPTSFLAGFVAFISSLIIVLAFTGVWLDRREQRRVEFESDRMRGLANAAVEGLVVFDGDTIAAVNNSFAAMAGVEADHATGQKLSAFFRDHAALSIFNMSSQPIEAELRHVSGASIPVELIVRPVEFKLKPHGAIAVRDLRARKEAEQHIRFLAHHDPLTGLPNRSSFNRKLDEEIAASQTNGQRLAVLCIDLDHFKEVNDLFGHASGDALLQAVSQSVTRVLQPHQMMARLGGDEFAVILPDLRDANGASRVAEDILKVIEIENQAASATARVSASIGIAIYPGDAADRQSLLTNADTALYRAKADGRGVVRFFEARLGAEVLERRILEHDLRGAVARRQLSLVYQPETDIKTNQITGFEALLRWTHPTRGEVEPSYFIPIAEDSGAILTIGEWVLRSACSEAASWEKPLTVAVNVSAVQLHAQNFGSLVREILIQTGLSPSRLELEITETAFVRDLNRAIATLRQVKALGVRVAMDDFGTGYSSLSNLRAFPFDRIKIDRSFVQAVNMSEKAATIVRAVLGLGRGLGLPVLAEGVETAGELQFLASEACDAGQGWLFGMPQDIDSYKHVTHGSGEAKPQPAAKPALRAVS
jgi:diguanylate cyclase (GGDEF)-like protein/PAS domain S-box-containing protein